MHHIVVAVGLKGRRPHLRGRFAAITAMAVGLLGWADGDCEACGRGEMAIFIVVLLFVFSRRILSSRVNWFWKSMLRISSKVWKGSQPILSKSINTRGKNLSQKRRNFEKRLHAFSLVSTTMKFLNTKIVISIISNAFSWRSRKQKKTASHSWPHKKRCCI